jgi:hypothetical protein
VAILDHPLDVEVKLVGREGLVWIVQPPFGAGERLTATGHLRAFVGAAESPGKPPLMGRPTTTPAGTQLTCLRRTT